MSNKRWEFTGEVKTWNGITLHRIRAVERFTLSCGITIEAGELGGWLEKEDNLSGNAWVSGDAWVCENARVSGDAWVCGNARVSGDARVCGNARVSGDARVCGNARVSGDAWVCGDAQVFGNARVCGNARVSGDAWVCGDARVSGDAWVCGDAQVYGDARVCGNAHLLTVGRIGSRAGTTTFFRSADGYIKVSCGCFYGTLDEFREKVRQTHRGNKHEKVYLLAADLAEAQIALTPEEGGR